MRIIATGLLLCISAAALADKPPAIKNTYGWDYMQPKTKCAKVTPALEKKLSGYACTVPDKGTSASGKDAVATCKNKDESDGYVFFAKLADCNAERAAQLANAE